MGVRMQMMLTEMGRYVLSMAMNSWFSDSASVGCQFEFVAIGSQTWKRVSPGLECT